MKIAESILEQELAGSLEANLSGLTEKHARQMHKKVDGTVKKLAKNFARLLAKEQRARDKQQRRATKASVESLVLKLHELLGAPAAESAPGSRVGTLAA
jgi:DNA topoisomerase VI subunit B